MSTPRHTPSPAHPSSWSGPKPPNTPSDPVSKQPARPSGFAAFGAWRGLVGGDLPVLLGLMNLESPLSRDIAVEAMLTDAGIPYETVANSSLLSTVDPAQHSMILRVEARQGAILPGLSALGSDPADYPVPYMSPTWRDFVDIGLNTAHAGGSSVTSGYVLADALPITEGLSVGSTVSMFDTTQGDAIALAGSNPNLVSVFTRNASLADYNTIAVDSVYKHLKFSYELSQLNDNGKAVFVRCVEFCRS